MVEGAEGRIGNIPGAAPLKMVKVRTGLPYEGDSGQGIALNTDGGEIKAILQTGPEAGVKAVLWAWGARGGFAGPAEGIFGDLAEEFTSQGITSLRLHYRYPGRLDESVRDVLCGLDFLRGLGCSRVTLVGHSFGGAVVIDAATRSAQVVSVVSLSPQNYGAQAAPYVSPRPLLIVHGLDDTRLPAHCARQIHYWARIPKELVLYPGAEHGLVECKDELRDLLRRWIPETLDKVPHGLGT